MRAIEFFCCSGGMAEGFRRAGIHFDFAFDADPDACASYEANLGHRPIQIDVRDLLRMAQYGWSPGELDLLVADPPCTPYSRAGKRLGPADPRDMLGTTIDLIRVFRPQAYLIGNVPGLDDSNHWPVIQDALATLGREGYCIRDYQSLDAADYGVPQHRVRPFWFGHLGGGCLGWPEPTHGAPGQPVLPGMPALAPWVTVRQALGGLSPEELGAPIRLRKRACNSNQHGSVEDSPARTVGTSNLSDGNVLLPELIERRRSDGTLREHIASAPAHTIRATRSSAERVVLDGPTSWPWDVPATTIQADPRIAPHGHHGHHGQSFLSSPNAIKLSERAAMILQGFPAGWTLAGKTKESRWGQLGMAMPPALACAVGSSIMKWFMGIREARYA